MSIIHTLVRKVILKKFFSVDLGAVEREAGEDSINFKYVPATRKAIFIGVLLIPAILFVDTSMLVNVLIPITMVTGTAWFAISLSSVKKKFEAFGLQLTTVLYRSFVSSIIALGLLAFFSLFEVLFVDISAWGQGKPVVQLISAFCAMISVSMILLDVYVGSLQYDINDSMLAGQAEAAERFYKKSLSLLYSSAENLRAGKGLEVANYYLGLSFFEVFNYVESTKKLNGKVAVLMEKAQKLKKNPAMPQEDADKISIDLLEGFVDFCVNIDGEKSEKSFKSIKEEIDALKNNKEPQNVVDTRLSVVFEEIAEMLESQGESLFEKR